MSLGFADDLVRRARPWLGTLVEIGVAAGEGDLIETGFVEIERIHQLMSWHEDTSDVAKLRAAKRRHIVDLDPDTVSILRLAQELHSATLGLFDVTIGRQLVRTGFLPRMAVEHLSRFSGTMRDIEIIDGTSVCVHRPVLIDFGGIGKGYAVDCAVAALREAGATCGIVNAGGDLRVFGPSAMPVQVRIAPGEFSVPFAICDCALASSENTQSRRRINGVIATPHIGRDRQPIIAERAVTVIAGTCAIADAMTKVALADPALAARVLACYGGSVVRFERDKAA